MIPLSPSWTRRRWLGCSAAGLLVGPPLAIARVDANDDAPKAKEAEVKAPLSVEQAEAKTRKAVEEKAEAAKIGPLLLLRSRHFQALGDVSETFLRLVLSDCEVVTDDFIRHFTAKGFTITLPARRLMVVALSSVEVYGQFLGQRASLASGGHYDLKNERLVVFDYRSARDRLPGRAGGGLNLLTLSHEVTHQLCYNGGVIDPEADTPRSIVEGLATYSEDRQPGLRTAIGHLNDARLDDLAHVQRQTPWLPVRSLFATDDALFGRKGGANLILAYAETWLLVYYLMNQPERLVNFRDYLRAIRTRRDASHRLEDATRYFGDLDRLDAELKRESIRLLKSR